MRGMITWWIHAWLTTTSGCKHPWLQLCHSSFPVTVNRRQIRVTVCQEPRWRRFPLPLRAADPAQPDVISAVGCLGPHAKADDCLLIGFFFSVFHLLSRGLYPKWRTVFGNAGSIPWWNWGPRTLLKCPTVKSLCSPWDLIRHLFDHSVLTHWAAHCPL